MTNPTARDPIYRRRRSEAEIIELCVRWYITYRLSYRDLVAMMAQRGLAMSHTTILRCVIHYVPEFEKRWNRWSRAVHSSWRVDETYICIRGRWHYLYRAVDKHGKTVDFLLRPDRGIAAAQAFFRKALSTSLPRWPRKITLDGHAPSHQALRLNARRRRVGASDSQATILVRSGSSVANRVTQAALGPGSRFSLMLRSDPPNRLFSRAASAPEPERSNDFICQ